jgi:hypothetical protein
LPPVAPAQARTPSNFYGLGLATYPTVPEFDQAARGGARLLRIQFYWGAVEPTPGARDWAMLDYVVGNAARSGAEVLPLLSGVPRWISRVGARPPIYSARQRAAWSRFITDLSARYGSRGAFWDEHPEIPRRPILWWEVWNEVNLSGYWGGRPSPRGYARLLRITRAALRAGDPGARTVLAGLLPYESRAPGGMPMETFMKRFVRARGARRSFDAFGVHPYAPSVGGVVDLVRKTRRLLNRLQLRSPIWITEFGWTTGGRRLRFSPFRATERVQAKRVRAALVGLRKQRRRLGIGRVLYFSFKDFNTPADNSWLTHLGLLRGDGTAKPAWRAFARAAGGRP